MGCNHMVYDPGLRHRLVSTLISCYRGPTVLRGLPGCLFTPPSAISFTRPRLHDDHLPAGDGGAEESWPLENKSAVTPIGKVFPWISFEPLEVVCPQAQTLLVPCSGLCAAISRSTSGLPVGEHSPVSPANAHRATFYRPTSDHSTELHCVSRFGLEPQ